MGEEIHMERIEVSGDSYQIDFKFMECGKSERCFIRKDAMLAMMCVAERHHLQYAPEVD